MIASMLKRVLPFLNKSIPANLASRGLEKVNPGFGKYFKDAVQAGYTLDHAIGFLRNKFEQSNAEEGQNLRPDERSSNQSVERSKMPLKIAKGAAELGATALGGYGAGLAAEALGNAFGGEQRQPQQQAQQPVNGNPRLSESGFPMRENQMQQPAQQQNQQQQSQVQRPAENRNIIEMYSPELHEFLMNEIQQGRPPLEAGALAQFQDKFKRIIQKLEKDHKTNFSSILQAIYGGGQYGGSVNPQQEQQQQTQQGQPSQTNQALMKALEAAKHARQQRQGQ